jgi:predicted phage-related endonuclease
MELISGSEPWRRAHLDGITEEHELVEAKTAGMIFLNSGSDWGEEGTDEIPDPYIVQVMHQFSLMPAAQVCWLPVLIRGDFRIYRVERKDDLIEMVLEKEREFWRKVENLERPEAQTSRDLNLLFPQHTDRSVEANQEIAEAIDDFKRTKGVIKDLEARIESLSFQIKNYMGEAETVYAGPKKLATWKTQTNNRLDMDRFKAEEPELYKKYLTSSTTRVLRMSKGV